MSISSLQRRLAPLLRPAGTAYAAAMRLRAARYAATGAYRAACPTVSVGNISWGGTGKTPIVDYLLGKTERANLKTVVLTRGYKASPPELPFPVTPESDPAAAGDEPLLLARRHPHALVLVDPKRRRAAAWAEKNAAPGLFLLDDGMQHLAVARDLNIVLLRPDDLLEGWNRVIPAGTWREDKTALARADAFCMKLDETLLPSIIPVAEQRLAVFGRPLFFFDLHPTGLTRLTAHACPVPETVHTLNGTPYTLLCGTGNPAHVRQTAASLLGNSPSRDIIVQDHHHYTETDAARARALGLPVVCTAKDAVKLATILPAFGDVPVWILEIQAVFGRTMFTDVAFDVWWDESLKRLLYPESAPSLSTAMR